jgi:hypothetical protein
MGHELGPNGRQVERMLDELHRLSDFQLLRLAAFGDRSAEPGRSALYASVADRVKRGGRVRAVERGREALGTWASWRKQLAAPEVVVSVASLTSDARRQALPAAYDAMVATVARDLLSNEEYDFLTAPWREATEAAPPEA